MRTSSGKRLMRSLWMTWEKAFGLFSRLRSAHTSRHGVCKLLVTKYRGACFQCQDGTWIHDGDWVGELHLDNEMVVELLRDGDSDRAALILARAARDALAQISSALETRPELTRVKALIGVTLLHRGLIHGLGFELRRIRSRTFGHLTTAYLRLLLSVLHPEGRRRLGRRRERLVPMMLIHTRSTLRRRFAPSRSVSSQAR
ncbi:polysaccharide deacetylase [Cohnella sp. CBP 2801]|uniref:Polysaccharide deacetylase n=2 Tax=Cohnella zeiphila TaxID=2761120 RepID=A0A7X0SP26_9BACL|nr:polysaccharide deacetylase [Cohnella zeiphila]MBB6733444.1 polysaccharide deacetylase [Cohnella zeiphila]